MIVFPLHTILRLLGNESKVHVFQAILFQEMLPTRVKTHLTRFRYKLYLMRFYSSRQDFFASSIARRCYQGRGEVSPPHGNEYR